MLGVRLPNGQKVFHCMVSAIGHTPVTSICISSWGALGCRLASSYGTNRTEPNVTKDEDVCVRMIKNDVGVGVH